MFDKVKQLTNFELETEEEKAELEDAIKKAEEADAEAAVEVSKRPKSKAGGMPPSSSENLRRSGKNFNKFTPDCISMRTSHFSTMT